jgi:tetratricopeptide (TPR) repeat protein
MVKHAQDLFNNRSTTQEFLFSHSADNVEDNQTVTDPADRQPPDGLPRNRLSGMLDRRELIDAIDTQMAAAGTLCALAVRLERKLDDSKPKTALPADAAAPLARHCHTHGGRWARIGRNRFAVVMADMNAAGGQDLAEDLLRAYAEKDKLSVTIGLAVYPTINYARRQIVDNAEKALEHGIFFGPGTITRFDAVSLNISGDRRYQTGDIEGAIDEFNKGLLVDPTDANLHNSLGVCHGILKAYDEALAAFDNADWLAPGEVMAIYNKGYILSLQGNREAALACFLEANDREPGVFEVAFHIGQIYMETGAADDARPYLEAATRANSRSGPAFKSLGACLEKLGLTKEAIRSYKSAVKINPGDAESLSVLGRLYTERGESLDVAEVLCAQSVRLDPENGLYRHRLATVYLKQGKLDDALSEFELALSLGHDSQSEVEKTQRRMLSAKAS